MKNNFHSPALRLLLRRCCAALAFAVAILPGAALAFVPNGYHWGIFQIPMYLQLGTSPTPLLDGNATFNTSAETALLRWNGYLENVKFNGAKDTTFTPVSGNSQNTAHFSNDVFGTAWGSGVVAVTLSFFRVPDILVESDVVFNKNLLWDSYRGPLRFTSAGARLYDVQRVAIHEFGHVLGLTHPDAAGQSVTAIMNTFVSDLDTLAADDINGARSIYDASVSRPPEIFTPPAGRSAAVGQSASFTVVVIGSAPFTYQWQKAGVAVAGATTATLSFASLALADAGSYTVRVANGNGNATSAAAVLTVGTLPTINASPATQSVPLGSSVTFTVDAGGTAPLTYQWRKAGATIGGATSASFVINSVQSSDAAAYSVVVTNAFGSVTSSSGTLTVTLLATITAPPVAQSVTAGNGATLSVTASSGTPATYQWRLGGVAIPGATSTTYSIPTTAPENGGSYTVTITNAAGSITTAPVTLAVNPYDAARIINLSIRTDAGNPADPLIVGFSLGGAGVRGNKAVLLRAVGPSLGAFGVTGFLVDPRITMYRGSSPIAANNDWSGDPQVSAVGTSVGAFAFQSPTSKDAAIYNPATPPESYTVQIAGADSSIGNVLAEIYDATPVATYSTLTPRLVNVSARAQAGGGGSLIAGFVIGGTGEKQVLIRAIGPTLGLFGLTGTLSDPKLTLYRGIDKLLENDDWGGSTALRDAFISVGAFALDSLSKDAAISARLAPGNYTAQVTGAGTSGGTVLIEIYDLP